MAMTSGFAFRRAVLWAALALPAAGQVHVPGFTPPSGGHGGQTPATPAPPSLEDPSPPEHPGPPPPSFPGLPDPGQPQGGQPGQGPVTGTPGSGGQLASGGGQVGQPSATELPLLDTRDPSVWQIWWEYNQDPFVPLREAVLRAGPFTGSDELFLGDAETPQGPADRAPSLETVHERIVPALCALAREGGAIEITSSALLALGRIGEDPRAPESHVVQDALERELAHPNMDVAEFATIALGAIATEAAAPLLVELAGDTPLGRKLSGRDSVPVRQRAFAAYGIALTGHLSSSADVRRYAIHHLDRLLATERTSSHDLEVACAIGLGMLVIDGPMLAIEPDTLRASASRQALVARLLELFEDDSAERLVRAHLPAAIGRLVEGEDGPQKHLVGEVLLAGIAKRSGEKQREVRQGCTVALGMVGDADDDPLDEEIRKGLMRTAEDGDVLSRRYAIVALSAVGARPGTSGGDPLAGSVEVKQFLLRGLDRGPSNLRPWYALALGILGRGLGEQSRPLKPEEAGALRKGLDECRSADDAGAYALGSAILGDRMATEAILAQLGRFEDEAARGHCALALGILHAGRAVDRLREVLRESVHRPEVLRQCASALALIGDPTLGTELVALLGACDCQLARMGVTTALGLCGERNAVEPLLGLLDPRQPQGIRAAAALALGRVGDRELLPWSSAFSRASNYGAGPVSFSDPGAFGIADLR